MKQSLLTKLHHVFLFPGWDEIKYKNPDKDPAMKKINRRAMGKFSSALSAWKVRVKARIIDKKEPYSEIVKDNPTITEEQFEIFKTACIAEATKEKSEYMKGLQERNMGCHHLGSCGHAGKRSIWAKEDAERESLGIPDPLAEFTVPQELHETDAVPLGPSEEGFRDGRGHDGVHETAERAAQDRGRKRLVV